MAKGRFDQRQPLGSCLPREHCPLSANGASSTTHNLAGAQVVCCAVKLGIFALNESHTPLVTRVWTPKSTRAQQPWLPTQLITQGASG